MQSGGRRYAQKRKCDRFFDDSNGIDVCGLHGCSVRKAGISGLATICAPIERRLNAGRWLPRPVWHGIFMFSRFLTQFIEIYKFFVSFYFTHILNTDRTKFVPSVPKRYVHHYETGKVMAGRYTKKRRIPIWRLKAISRMDIGDIMLPALDVRHMAAWRDERLKTISSSTVNREWNFLSNASSIMVSERKWLHENPVKFVKKRPSLKSRERRITEDTTNRLLFALGDDYE